ncbi:MAG: LysR family transcriptional regulator [Geminicoccaceae bacterium]|nr:LysR family transcriptional regulator [Geminicoccaceae bacterium]
MTLHQLRIFWAVVHSPSLTAAAKQLGLSQPSLSQHLARLEQALGGRLFDRARNQLRLTDAGRFLVRKAEAILTEVAEIETGFAAFTTGRRGRIAIGALGSLARSLLPATQAEMAETFPDLEFDIHELSPREAIDQLYGRFLQIALLSVSSVADNRVTFTRIPLTRDPYLLAVPPGLDLDGVTQPERELPPKAYALLNRTIQFQFGNQHTNRVEAFYRQILPRHHVVATSRHYETALAMVERGVGIALVPQLTTELRGRPLFDVRLHALPLPPRSIAAYLPSQNLRLEPYTALIGALERAGDAISLRPAAPTPPFVETALARISRDLWQPELASRRRGAQ